MRARAKPPVGPIRRLPENYIQQLDGERTRKIARTKAIFNKAIPQVEEMLSRLEEYLTTGQVTKLKYWSGRYGDRIRQLIDQMDRDFRASNLLPIEDEEVPEFGRFEELTSLLRASATLLPHTGSEAIEWARKYQKEP